MTITRTPDQIVRPPWLPTDQWPFTLRRHRHLTDEGRHIDIHYTDEGQGPTLVFVHAGMWSFVWRDVITALRPHFRCLTIDFPGTGLSGGDRADITIESFPSILDAVLNRCNVDRACFVVHDLGGAVGVETAALRPERASGLVAANSFSWVPDRFSLRSMLALMGNPVTAWTLGTMRVVPRLTRTAAGVGRTYGPDDRAAFFGPYRSRARSRNFHRTMRSAGRADQLFDAADRALAGPLAHLPVLTVFGQHNDPFGFADQWKRRFPQAEQWTVDGGNHFPMCDDPEGFVEQLTGWYAKNVVHLDGGRPTEVA